MAKKKHSSKKSLDLSLKRPNFKILSDVPENFQQLIHGSYSGTYNAARVDANGVLISSFSDSGGSLFHFPLTAFGEVRTAKLMPQAGWTFNYNNINTDMIAVTISAVGGSVTTASGKAQLIATTAGGTWAGIQTKLVQRYIPGMGTLARFTAIFNAGKASSTQYIGIGDNSDGFFFGYQGATFGVLRRRSGDSSTGWIPQSSWNGDKLDGTGLSGIKLDPAKGNVYSIGYQWMGFGAITFYIENPNTGELILVHRISYANANTIPSILNPTLPLSARVDNNNTSDVITLQTGYAMVFTEGVPGAVLVTRNSSSSVSASVTTQKNLLTIQNKTSYPSNGSVNRVYVQPDFLSFSAESAETPVITVKLIKNAALTGASWTDVSSTTSVMRYDISATISGGTELLSLQLVRTDLSLQYLLDSLDIVLNPGDTLTITGSATKSSNMYAAISWREFF